ncbi:MAG: hypothetical protein NC341_06520 [Blautia sp.]|nr:hypothetical protein [Blautia sp.]MCM1200980.1 hypothetical protein [Bacteroides fragilis]
MGNRPLLIPFRTESYVTNDQNTPDKMCARISPDYAQVEYDSRLGGNMEPSPFTVRPPLPAGVHLHFILPECFRQARQKKEAAGSAWKYAEAPDRWVVTRLIMDGEHRISNGSFIVESNYIGLDNNDSVAIPCLEDPAVSHRFLGRAYAYGKGGKGTGGYLDSLTAMGAGNPYFAAYYPDCRSVFGFYDDMAGVEEGCDVTYFINGYFSDKTKDPLYHATQQNFRQILQELGLEVKAEAFYADGIVLFSEVCHIRWDGYRGRYPDARPAGEVRCGLGNTSAEVVSAIIAGSGKDGYEKDKERLFNALQYEMADELEEIDGIACTEDAIHAQTFFAGDGGSIWKLDYEEAAAGELPENAGRMLADLNEKCRQCAGKRDEIAYWKDNAYAAWYSYMLQYEGTASESPAREEMRKEIFRICEEVIPALERELAQQKKEADDSLAGLRTALAGSGAELTQAPDGAFHEPKEPVLMLYGDGIKRNDAFEEEKPLLCQSAPITGLSDGTHMLRKADILKYTGGIPEIIPFFSDYLIQAVCLDEKMVEGIGAAEKLPGLVCNKSALSPLACRTFEQSWQTFMLEWRVKFHPSRTPARSTDDSMAYWRFDGLDYDNREAYRGNAVVYAGRTMVTPHSLYRFRYTAAKYMKESGMEEEEIGKILKGVEELPVLSQNLDGFNSLLLSRIRALQAPVIGNEDDEKLTEAILKALPTEKKAVNDALPHFPLRAGHLRLEKANLLSTFGMIQSVSTSRAPFLCSEVLGEYKDPRENTEYALLRPRIMGEARFRFDFVCADNAGVVAEAAPDTSPICGMIMPELLNSRLVFYSAKGSCYGGLKTVYRKGKRLARWISPPGQAQIPFEEIPFEDENLKKMIAYLLQDSKKGGTAYTDLLLLIGQQLDRALPSGLDMGAELPWIWGRPLAVFRCRASLERRGGLAYSQLRKDYAEYDTLAVEKIRFPLMAGDMSRVRSGIVGYFESFDYARLYPAYHAEEFASDYIRFGEYTGLCVNDRPKQLTMIAEIGNPLYFQTGILPTGRYDIPAVHTRFADEIMLCFEADSVMCIPGAPQLPTPAVKDDASWYFSYVDNSLGEGRDRMEKIACMENLFQDERNIVCDGYLTLKRNGG